MTARRLRVLIQNLPAESATWTALRNALSEEELAAQAEKGEPEKGRWSQHELLLASTLDAIRRVEYVLTCANSDKSKWPKAPEATRRPGAGPAKPKSKMSEAQANHLFTLINGGAA